MTVAPAIRIAHASKSFNRKTQALNDVNITIQPGECVGLLRRMPLWRRLSGRFTHAERVQAVQVLDAVRLADYTLQRAAVEHALVQGVQLMSVTSGTGMSTAFALAEECLTGKETT